MLKISNQTFFSLFQNFQKCSKFQRKFPIKIFENFQSSAGPTQLKTFIFSLFKFSKKCPKFRRKFPNFSGSHVIEGFFFKQDVPWHQFFFRNGTLSVFGAKKISRNGTVGTIAAKHFSRNGTLSVFGTKKFLQTGRSAS